MAINLPGPYEIDIEYVTNARNHHARMSCATIGTPSAGDDPDDISLATRAAGAVSMTDAVQGFWDRYRLALPTAGGFLSATLYRFTPGTLIRQFISVVAVTNPAGAGGTSVPNWQNIASFRSANGGIVKIEWLEGNSAGDTQIPLIPSGSGNGFSQMAAYIVSGSNWVLARDDGWPIQARVISSGQNERLWKDSFR